MAKAGPIFIYIGTPKAGSSWLFEALNEHPEIFVHPAKCSGRFETTTPGDFEKYRDSYADANNRASGEIAHDTYTSIGTVTQHNPTLSVACAKISEKTPSHIGNPVRLSAKRVPPSAARAS